MPMRNPVLLGKQLGSVDRLANGRLIVGAGSGWWREEFDAVGAAWDHRGKRLEEWIGLMRAMWRDEWVEFEGEFVRLDGWTANPKPPQGTIPIWLGGHVRAQQERAGRVADGLMAPAGTPDALREAWEVVSDAATRAGRDPTEIQLASMSWSVLATGRMEEAAEHLGGLAELGVDHATTLIHPRETDRAEELLAEFDGEWRPKIDARARPRR
jgi:alkanesulfonate monooxygenase SsuD/methylene tetrahydromethanopterin reductase-like flavin-dependent oxidoreductase (luciferase family)